MKNRTDNTWRINRWDVLKKAVSIADRDAGNREKKIMTDLSKIEINGELATFISNEIDDSGHRDSFDIHLSCNGIIG